MILKKNIRKDKEDKYIPESPKWVNGIYKKKNKQ